MPEQEMVEKPSKPPAMQFDQQELPEMLRLYYKRLFPHQHFYRWLSYGNSEVYIFSHREISFTLHDDIYIRYLSFESQGEMEKEICAKCPHKIDIGAVMATVPKKFRQSSKSMLPTQRELVFDIDMTDYDDVRTCCSGADVCVKCWKFMVVAARVLEAALREDFGFEHMFWVFSGRRGVHCWVCDHNARHLDSQGRNAVAEYLHLVTHVVVGGVSVPRVHLPGDRMHHSIKRALRYIEPLFDEIILEDQNLFGTPAGVVKLLQLITDDGARRDVEAYLRKTHEDGARSRAVWQSFVRYANSMRTGGGNGGIWGRKLRHIVEEMQICLLYPRLDINVTKGFNHLLKAPFCIHPSTGKVCVPFSASAVAKFDPSSVPNIAQLLQEINAFDDKTDEGEKSRIKDYKKTGMFKGVVVFEEFLRKLESSFKKKAIDVSDQKMEF